MLDVINCPGCQRALALPGECRDQDVQCPACRMSFRLDAHGRTPTAAVPPTPAPKVVTLVAEPGPGTPARAPRRRPAQPLATPERRPRRTMHRGLLGIGITLVVGVFALGLFGVIAAFVHSERRIDAPIAPFVVDQPLPPNQALLDHGDKPLPGDATVRELEPLFDDLGAAFAAGDQGRIMAHFDVERSFDAFAALGILPPVALKNRPAFVQGMRTSMGRALTQQAAVLTWNRSEYRRIKKPRANEAVVIVRHHGADGIVLKMRWWVAKSEGAWHIYDFEDLDVGLRFSAAAGSALAGGFANQAQFAAQAKRLGEAIVALAGQNVDVGANKLQEMEQGPKLPRELEAVRWLFKGVVSLHNNQPREALGAFDQADALVPGMRGLDRVRGTAFNRLGERVKALKHLRAYQEMLGDDGPLCRELGDALVGVRRNDEACAAYRTALDYSPKDADAFFGLIRALPPDDARADLPARFARLDQPRENFDTFCEDCRQANDGASLALLAEAMRRIDPAYPPSYYGLALARAWAGRADQAVAAFREALAKEKDAGKRRGYTTAFLEAMARSGLVRPAYAIAPEPREAFRILAGATRKMGHADELRPLVIAHARKDPDDPLLPFFRATVYVQEGRYALADKTFVAGMAHPPDPPMLDSFQSSRVIARYHAGQALDALATIGPRAATFTQLAQLCVKDRKDALLEQLIDAHARTAPDDAQLPRYRWRLKARQNDAVAAAAVFQAALAAQAQPEQRRQMLSNFLFDMVDAGKPVEGYRAAPDPIEAFRILANDCRGPHRQGELKQILAAYRADHPGDIWLTYYTGILALDNQQWAEAARLLGEAWRRAPAADALLFRADYRLALYKDGHALEAYRQFEPRGETFLSLARLMVQDGKEAELQALLDAHRPHAGDDPDWFDYQACARVWAGQFALAIADFRKAQQLQTDAGVRTNYARRFVGQMQRAGHGLEGYRAASEPVPAFEVLARQLTDTKKANELEALLAEHAGAKAKSPWRTYYAGELALLRNDPERARQSFAAALAAATTAQQWTIRDGLNRARIRLNQAVPAYQEAGSATQAFREIADLCVRENNAKQLTALIAAHRQDDPDDPALPAWEVDVKWLTGDHAGALAAIAPCRANLPPHSPNATKLEAYVVRCLVKLKRTDEAVREAEALVNGNRWRSRVLLVLAHAAAGDMQQAMAVVERAPLDRYLLYDCYQDPDLGPILRGDGFQAFRTRFPEPKMAPFDLEDDD